jgi:regulator of replication initiation timing
LKNDGIPFDFFIKSVVLMVIISTLSIFKVYISNKIYAQSREINRLNMEVVALKEERSILSMNIEKLRYKTEILDTIEIEKRESDNDIPKPKGLTPEDIKKLFGGNRGLNIIQSDSENNLSQKSQTKIKNPINPAIEINSTQKDEMESN